MLLPKTSMNKYAGAGAHGAGTGPAAARVLLQQLQRPLGIGRRRRPRAAATDWAAAVDAFKVGAPTTAE